MARTKSANAASVSATATAKVPYVAPATRTYTSNTGTVYNSTLLQANATIVGKITKIEDLSADKNGKHFQKFTLVVKDSKTLRPTWVNVTLFGDAIADFNNTFVVQNLIEVKGDLYLTSYDKEGETRFFSEMTSIEIYGF
jgi:Single-strand binding protein family